MGVKNPSATRAQRILRSIRIWSAAMTSCLVVLVGVGIAQSNMADHRSTWLFDGGASYVKNGDICTITMVKSGKYSNVKIPNLVYQRDVKVDKDLADLITMPERAYTLDFRHEFTRLTPQRKNSYMLDEMNRLQGLESVRTETMSHVRWILQHSLPFLSSPEECARAAQMSPNAQLSENDIVVATQAAIWSVVSDMEVTDFGQYEGRTENVGDYYTALIKRMMSDDRRTAASYNNSDTKFARVEVKPGNAYASDRRGRFGPFRITANLTHNENYEIWLEEMDPSERGACLTFNQRAEATPGMGDSAAEKTETVNAVASKEDSSKTERMEISPGKDFYVDTLAAMTQNGEITLRVQNRIKVSYQSELLVWDTIKNDNAMQYASLVTAGRFISKPSETVKITWGQPKAATSKIAAALAGKDSGDDSGAVNYDILSDEVSSVQAISDASDEDLYLKESRMISEIVMPSGVTEGDPSTPNMLIVLHNVEKLDIMGRLRSIGQRFGI